MRGLLRDVLARRSIAGLAIAIAAALALSSLAKAVVDLGVLLTLNLSDPGLSFTVKGTNVYYGDVVEGALAFVLLVAALLGLWRLGRGRTRVCPDCRSDVDPAATVCPMCTSEIGPA